MNVDAGGPGLNPNPPAIATFHFSLPVAMSYATTAVDVRTIASWLASTGGAGPSPCGEAFQATAPSLWLRATRSVAFSGTKTLPPPALICPEGVVSWLHLGAPVAASKAYTPDLMVM